MGAGQLAHPCSAFMPRFRLVFEQCTQILKNSTYSEKNVLVAALLLNTKLLVLCDKSICFSLLDNAPDMEMLILWAPAGKSTLLEKFWRISLYFTDDAIAKLSVT